MGAGEGASSDTVVSEQVKNSGDLKTHRKKFPKVGNLVFLISKDPLHSVWAQLIVYR